MPINYKDYPANWKELREKVLDRAKHSCENCGVANHAVIHRYGKGISDWEYVCINDERKKTKVVLTIAHLDHDKSNHDVSIERLRAWCQKCHLQYDLAHHVRNRKYGRNHDNNNHKLEL